MTMLNYKIKYFMKSHKYQKIRVLIFLLLSFAIIFSVIALLIKPAVSMTGDLTCMLEEHTHTEECYSYVLACGQNESAAHYHDEACFEKRTVIICQSDEPAHVHDSECYEEKNILICNKTEGEGHIHTDECRQKQLTCTKPEHVHSNSCYSGRMEADASQDILNPEIDVDDSVLAYIGNDMSGQNISYYSGTEIDTNVSVNFSKNISSISYTETSSTITEDDTKPVKFTINYVLPSNTLMQVNNNKQIYYKLPDNVIITEEQTGPVKEDGKQTGTYKITTDGYIIIDFLPNYVMDGTKEIAGDIMFNANVKRTDKNSDKETVTMGNATVDVDFTTVKKNDLSVKKTNSGYDAVNKTIDYNISISSVNGSGNSINVSDCLVNADQNLIKLNLTDGQTISVEKKKADGTSETFSVQVSIADDGKMTLSELPALEAGESYSINYSALVTPGSKAVDFKAENEVIVTSDKLTSRDKNYVDVVTGCVLKKTGSYNERTDKIKWTITILNPLGQDISGYSVTDQMLGQAIDGSIKVLDKNNNIVENAGTLSTDDNTFTFGSLTGSEYKLVYETNPSGYAMENVNNAELKDNNNESVNSDTGKAYVGSNRLYVNKNRSSGGYDSDGNIIIKWTVELQYQQGKFAAKEYTDNMSSDKSEHYMTVEQFNNLTLTGKGADWTDFSLVKDTDYTIIAFDQNGNEITDFSAEDVKISSFKVTFAENDTVNSLADVYINYSSIGTIDSSMAVGDKVTFTNHAEFLGIEKDSIYEETKKDSIKKYDGMTGSISDSTHRVTELDKTENGDYILKWYIIANESNNYGSQDAVLTDTLPEGVSFIESSVKFQNRNGSSFTDSDGMTYVLSGDSGNQQVVFTVPANVHNGNPFKISYSVSVSEEYIREHKSGLSTPFKNTVSDGTDSKSQTQEITSALISKSSSDPANTYDGDVAYTLDVNPYAEQLSDTGKITVKDRLRSYAEKNDDGTLMYNWGFTASLLSLEVYNADTNEQLQPSEYKLSHYEEDTNGIYSVLLLELPDEMHIRIEYIYHLSLNDPNYNSGYVNSYGGAVENYAELDFSVGTDKTSNKQFYQLNKESGAHSTTSDYIKIRKTDSENFAIRLGNAKFQLYQWNNDVWQPLINKQEKDENSILPVWGNENDTPLDLVTNDASGEYLLPELDKKVLYKLVEVQAPDGYMPRRYPYYFIFSSYPDQLPSGMQISDINVLLKGGIIEIGNSKLSDVSVTVNKYWADNTLLQPVEVQLYKSASQSEAPKTINVNISDKYGKSIEKRYKVDENSEITLTVKTLNAFIESQNGYIKVNGEIVNIYGGDITYNHTWNGNADGDLAVCMTYKINSVDGNTTIDLYFGDCQAYSKYDISLTNCTEVSKSAVFGAEIPDDAELVENSLVTLSPDNNWTYTWTELPQGKSDGTLYYYYVKEITDIKGYTAEFDTNGINGGEINLTNRKETEKPTLPTTGGNGVQNIMIMGLLIIIIPVSYYYLFNRRKGRR